MRDLSLLKRGQFNLVHSIAPHLLYACGTNPHITESKEVMYRSLWYFIDIFQSTEQTYRVADDDCGSR